jgi:RNA polymerase sigma-70 factor (ECF subfamily)
VLAGDVAEMIASESVERESVFEQQRTALQHCLEKIAPGNRQLLLDSYRSELKIQAVAATSGRTVGAFYQWLHRMRRILLDCVQQEVAK